MLLSRVYILSCLWRNFLGYKLQYQWTTCNNAMHYYREMRPQVALPSATCGFLPPLRKSAHNH
eukprot:5422132-Amphidinium_carterae.1